MFGGVDSSTYHYYLGRKSIVDTTDDRKYIDTPYVGTHNQEPILPFSDDPGDRDHH